MATFLHLADVHLGYNKYESPERTKDFFLAFQDALQKYAIAPQVDFVLIAGDLFEQRQILPAILNQAQLCLEALQAAGIPVLAIEGNHDYEPYGSPTSWLRYLSGWGKLILLKPDDEAALEPWDPVQKKGSYIDLDCGVRVIGSRWYGATAPFAIAKLAASIEVLPPGPPHTVMMFHHGLEGKIARYKGALRYRDFLPLKEAGVDYLALGHIHQQYSVENWIFNPGSVEANSILENQAQNPRGVYSVDLTPQGVRAQLQQEYQQRPILRLSLKVTSQQTPADVEAQAIALVETAAAQQQTQNTLTELRIYGNARFNRLDLDIKTLKLQLEEISQALIFLLKYEISSVEHHSPIGETDEPPSRQEIERSIFTDMLAEHIHYRNQAAQYCQGLIDLKDRVLQEQPEADLYALVSSIMQANSPQTLEIATGFTASTPEQNDT